MIKTSVLQIGPDPENSQGGMATVIGNICADQALKNEYAIELYPSFRSGPAVYRVAYADMRLMLFMLKKPIRDLYHIHVADGRSLWRKLGYVHSLGNDSDRVILHVHAATFDTFYFSCSVKERDRIRDSFSRTGRVIVLSKEWEDFFLTNEICLPEKMTVLHNAVRLPNTPLANYGSSDILFLGRLGERKSPDVLIHAAARVIKNHQNAVFHFAGDGNSFEYERLAFELGISDHCVFHGWIDASERDLLFRRCCIHCLPSQHEGMPMSILESMAAGLANVCTPVGGIPQVIHDGENGFIIPVGNYVMLADCISGLLEDRDRLRQIGIAGRNTIQNSFGQEAFIERLSRIYSGVLVGASASGGG